MRNVSYSTMVSLDGFTAGPNQNLDWVIADEELYCFINDREREIDTETRTVHSGVVMLRYQLSCRTV